MGTRSSWPDIPRGRPWCSPMPGHGNSGRPAAHDTMSAMTRPSRFWPRESRAQRMPASVQGFSRRGHMVRSRSTASSASIGRSCSSPAWATRPANAVPAAQGGRGRLFRGAGVAGVQRQFGPASREHDVLLDRGLAGIIDWIRTAQGVAAIVAAIFATMVAWRNRGLPRLVVSPEPAPISRRDQGARAAQPGHPAPGARPGLVAHQPARHTVAGDGSGGHRVKRR
jgi:hypothetical protein